MTAGNAMVQQSRETELNSKAKQLLSTGDNQMQAINVNGAAPHIRIRVKQRQPPTSLAAKLS